MRRPPGSGGGTAVRTGGRLGGDAGGPRPTGRPDQAWSGASSSVFIVRASPSRWGLATGFVRRKKRRPCVAQAGTTTGQRREDTAMPPVSGPVRTSPLREGEDGPQGARDQEGTVRYVALHRQAPGEDQDGDDDAG